MAAWAAWLPVDGMATDGYYGTGYSILYEYGILSRSW